MTTISKGRSGWRAETTFVLAKDHDPEYGDLLLDLTTGKINDKFMSLASCTHKKDGITHTLFPGDYFRRVAYYDGPCTKNKVQKYHELFVASAPTWVAEAKRHYMVE